MADVIALAECKVLYNSKWKGKLEDIKDQMDRYPSDQIMHRCGILYLVQWRHDPQEESDQFLTKQYHSEIQAAIDSFFPKERYRLFPGNEFDEIVLLYRPTWPGKAFYIVLDTRFIQKARGSGPDHGRIVAMR